MQSRSVAGVKQRARRRSSAQPHDVAGVSWWLPQVCLERVDGRVYGNWGTPDARRNGGRKKIFWRASTRHAAPYGADARSKSGGIVQRFELGGTRWNRVSTVVPRVRASTRASCTEGTNTPFSTV